jgi:hypothetical protein
MGYPDKRVYVGHYTVLFFVVVWPLVESCRCHWSRSWRVQLKEFAITITPRLYETDAMGHINNAIIAAWFEVVRVRFLESLVDRSTGIARD